MKATKQVIAIRQKGTDLYLPAIHQSTKATRARLTPLADCIPRLFVSHAAANRAMDFWLAGVANTKKTKNPSLEFSFTPALGRQTEDQLEFVIFNLTETQVEIEDDYEFSFTEDLL